MNLLKTAFIVILALLYNGKEIIAQVPNPTEHCTHEQQHEHPKNEIGAGNYLTYLAGEQEFSYGLHIHYLRTFEDSRFGLGFGYEQIFDEHKHRTLGIIGTCRLIDPIILALSPGILFRGHENSDLKFALHAEAVYEFEISNFHLGPALGFAYNTEEYHVSFGLHFAYTF